MQNKSGMIPVEDKVVVLPDDVSDRVGQIFKPDIAKDMERAAQTVATLVACGPNAFEEWEPPVPKPGDIVYVTKYAGMRNILGEDGNRYQIIADRDVTAILTEKFRDIQKETFGGTRKPLGVNNE